MCLERRGPLQKAGSVPGPVQVLALRQICRALSRLRRASVAQSYSRAVVGARGWVGGLKRTEHMLEPVGDSPAGRHPCFSPPTRQPKRCAAEVWLLAEGPSPASVLQTEPERRGGGGIALAAASLQRTVLYRTRSSWSQRERGSEAGHRARRDHCSVWKLGRGAGPAPEATWAAMSHYEIRIPTSPARSGRRRLSIARDERQRRISRPAHPPQATTAHGGRGAADAAGLQELGLYIAGRLVWEG
eukprot:scaffold695_cov384-Prasinococcus_capsulatus_cf.AAC.19